MDLDDPRQTPPRYSGGVKFVIVWGGMTLLYVGLAVAAFYTGVDLLGDLAFALLVFGVVGLPILGIAYLGLTRLQAYIDSLDGPPS